MNVILKFSEFWLPFLGNKGKRKLVWSENVYHAITNSLTKNWADNHHLLYNTDSANFVKSGWSDHKQQPTLPTWDFKF